jgi:hypothetical protein
VVVGSQKIDRLYLVNRKVNTSQEFRGEMCIGFFRGKAPPLKALLFLGGRATDQGK